MLFRSDGFNDGLPRASCGEVTLKQGEQIPTDALECMNSAIGLADAELAVVSLTTEGDPIVTFYRTIEGTPGIEIFIDGEFDRYGPKTWAHETCPDQTTFTSTQKCSTG